MTSPNGNIFRITGPLCGEFTGHRWIPLTKTSYAEIWCFLWSAPAKRLSKQSSRRLFETPLCSLWRHCIGLHVMYDDVIEWKQFPRYWPFVWGTHRSPVNFRYKGTFDVLFDLHLNKRLSKQSWVWWFETPSCPLWRHCNGFHKCRQTYSCFQFQSTRCNRIYQY